MHFYEDGIKIIPAYAQVESCGVKTENAGRKQVLRGHRFMKLYSMHQEPTKDPELLKEYRESRETGLVRVGEKTLFFKVRLRVYYVPFSDIRRLFRRVFVLPGNGRAGKGGMQMENLVICGEEGELAQIQLPGAEAARELMKELKEKVPHADFSSLARKKTDEQPADGEQEKHT